MAAWRRGTGLLKVNSSKRHKLLKIWNRVESAKNECQSWVLFPASIHVELSANQISRGWDRRERSDQRIVLLPPPVVRNFRSSLEIETTLPDRERVYAWVGARQHDTMHFIIYYSCTHSQKAFDSKLGYPRVMQAVRLTETMSNLVSRCNTYAHKRFEGPKTPIILVLLDRGNYSRIWQMALGSYSIG